MTNRTNKTKNEWLEIPLDDATGGDGRRAVEVSFPRDMTPSEFRKVLMATGWCSLIESEPPYTQPNGRWEVVPATDDHEQIIGYRVRWSIPDKHGRYLWVGHYYSSETTSIGWCENAAESHAKRLSERGRSFLDVIQGD